MPRRIALRDAGPCAGGRSRFRDVPGPDGDAFVAWYEPDHHIVEAAAPFFVKRFASLRWTILTPERSAHPVQATRAVLRASLEGGLKNPPVRFMMLAAPFTEGVGFYVFYALQPYLLQLFGDPKAYAIAGLAAAIVAGADIVGGWLAPLVRKLVGRRTTVLIGSTIASSVVLVVLLPTHSFWLALVLLSLWAVVASAGTPVRQAYLNDMIASKQRATVLSFASLMGSSGGVVVQPVLGRTADLYGYPASLALGGAVQLLAAPFIVLSRRRRSPADVATGLAAP